ncbi:MAG: ethanolamine ammonia-lyase reactivating factor EutA [Eubacteriales bacterium]
MNRELLSVGIDLGTTTTQLVFSKLTVKNTATAFTMPHFAITQKRVIYRSDIHFTPLLSQDRIDVEKLKKIVNFEYQTAEISPENVETGAVIITGETARKENAKEVLEALSAFAGDFVVATAGPDLESVLAGKGAKCDSFSKSQNCDVLNLDMGGGTSNLCQFSQGEPIATGCFNVGGRLLKLDEAGEILYKSPVISPFFTKKVGEIVTQAQVAPLVATLVEALEEAVGLQPKTALFDHFTTEGTHWEPPKNPPILSFSGGVADMVYRDVPPHWLAYGDLGVLLGQAIRRSKLMDLPHYRPQETIGATVVGAGSHTTTLSGSTICFTDLHFPLKNLPVLQISEDDQGLQPEKLEHSIEEKLHWFWENQSPAPVVLSLKGFQSPSFAQVNQLAQSIAQGMAPVTDAKLPLLLCVSNDMGKALGQAILCNTPNQSLLCMDGLDLETGSYVDIGSPVGSALPVVIKTLIFTSK